ncbi:MAG: N-formylglutamate deformylase [Rhodospirillum sp.]|nr:N-formylglutamate deformylase [Rhodospirillum sp.]MCF8488708.1 N-formylglutamate deformylase [Rhodospirillum sp.]MCF8502167.1 N-formylglutamate deformylase [Rhodospirillum sp.]
MTPPRDWLAIHRGDAPLILGFPHVGTTIPPEIEARLVTPWLARKDADWWVDKLYAFAKEMGATLVGTTLSRTVIDVNRDPSGVTLYPGQVTTGLCPVEGFDGDPLYQDGRAPDEAEIARRRALWFDPYHAALEAEIARLRAVHPRVVLYDCHSIRSAIPRLFEGVLPVFNLGTNSGVACAPELERAAVALLAVSGQPFAVNGRFKGGYVTRHHGRPETGVHALQMELACRGYMDEPIGPVQVETWPCPLDDARAAPTRATLRALLEACLTFARDSDSLV